MSAKAPRIPYVQSSASLEVPPPYHFPGVTVNAFVWEPQIELVQAYCDRYLNIGREEDRGFSYRPFAAWPYATLLVMDYPVMISTTTAPPQAGLTPYCDRGIVTQTEIFVALPVVRTGTGWPGAVTHSALNWTIPFIVVGNPMSCVSGREMVGLGKLLADMTIGPGKFPGSFSATMALPGIDPAWPGQDMTMLEFMKLETAPVLPTFRSGTPPWRSLATLLESREAGWFMDSMASMSNFVDWATAGIVPTSMRTVGLKQYRDAENPERAIYQALVTCRSNYSNLRGFAFYDEKDVDIRFNDIDSFHEILSVFLPHRPEATGGWVKVPVKAAMRFTADIDFDEMRVIYESAIDRPHLPPIPSRRDTTAGWFRPIKGFFGPRHPA